MLPEVMTKIEKFIKTLSVSLVSENVDGRINSALSESIIIDKFNAEFDIIVPTMRNWYDVAVRDNGNIYYVNIKITNLDTKASDNISSKKGLCYALSGIIPSNDRWNDTLEIIAKNENPDTDYYFIVIDKTDVSRSYVTSLKHLKSITPNGNNLPFQSKWADNHELVERSYDEARAFILSKMRKSLELRAMPYKAYMEIFE